MIIEITGEPSKLSAFIDFAKQNDMIIEMCRAGAPVNRDFRIWEMNFKIKRSYCNGKNVLRKRL